MAKVMFKAFWKTKIIGNRVVDERSYKALQNNDWRILTIWECAIKGKERLDPAILANRIEKWLLSCNKFGKSRAGRDKMAGKNVDWNA